MGPGVVPAGPFTLPVYLSKYNVSTFPRIATFMPRAVVTDDQDEVLGSAGHLDWGERHGGRQGGGYDGNDLPGVLVKAGAATRLCTASSKPSRSRGFSNPESPIFIPAACAARHACRC